MITIAKKNGLKGCFTVPGDKSISHRSVMFGAIADGITEISGFLMGEDCLSTISCFRNMGIQIDLEKEHVIVHGKGLHGLTAPQGILDIGNSGTTLRLLTGILAAQPFSSGITGDASIRKRPMDRVCAPLALMGAQISAKSEPLTAPLTITGQKLHGIRYTMPVASAQVKSAILLAGLFAEGETIIKEPIPSRNHTEIMLRHMGADLQIQGQDIHLTGRKALTGQAVFVPGDISSAAYFLAAALLCPGSLVTIQNVGVNDTRTGILDALKRMGANIEIKNIRSQCGEPSADLTASYSRLKGIEVSGAEIPRLIDEIPVLAVVACYAEGTTVIRDAAELKVKESNRIHTTVTELRKLGAQIEETADGMVIHGGKPLSGGAIESHNDHRIAMAAAVAALAADKDVSIENPQCVDISFPGFYDYIAKL